MCYCKKFSFLVLLLSILLFSCKNTSPKVYVNDATKNILFTSLKYDTIFLKPLTFSGTGFFRIFNNRIYFFDDLFLTISEFDTQGDYIKRYLGRGEEGNEIHDFLYAGFLRDSSLFFLGKSYNLSFYSPQFQRERSSIYIDWSRKKHQYNINDVNKIGTYSFNYFNGIYDTRWLPVNSKNKLIVPLWISPNVNPSLNGFKNSIQYYKKAKTVGVIDLNTGKVQNIFGRKSSYFESHPYIPNYDFLSLDVKNDTIYVCQSVDSLIQVYSPTYKLIAKFGFNGKNMKTNYPIVKTTLENDRIWIEAFKNYGYYYDIYCDKSSDLIFRSYTKNRNNVGGLQIYKKHTLIADVSVPKRFNVIGKIGKYYYADGIETDVNNTLAIYRFKLPINSN